MSASYRNRFKKEPQIKIGSKTENVAYSTKNIDPNLNYLNRQIYEEESLSKARQKRQLAEYSYYAQAVGQTKSPFDNMHSKVNFDNLTGKIGQELKEEDFYKYTQGKSKIHGNNIAMNNKPNDIRGMNYHGYNIINNDIFGFYNPDQKFPKSSYQTNYQPKTLENDLANLTPEQFEDYKKFREEQLKALEAQKSQKEQIELNQIQRDAMTRRNDIEGQALRKFEQEQFNYPQKEQDQYEQMLRDRELRMQQQQQELYERKIKAPMDNPPLQKEMPDNIPKDVPRDIPRENIEERVPSNPQVPESNNIYQNDEMYQKAYQEYMMKQQQNNQNPESNRQQQIEMGGNPNIPKKEDNIPREQNIPYQEPPIPQSKLPNGISDEEYMNYINYLRQREEEEALKMRQQQQAQPTQIQQEEINERERYQNYLKAQEQEANLKAKQDPEYLSKVKHYEEIVQGGDDEINPSQRMNEQEMYYQQEPKQVPNYHMAKMQSQPLQGATPGKIDKTNYISGNPCKSFNIINNTDIKIPQKIII